MQFMWKPTWNDLSEVFQVIRGLDEGIMQVSVGQKARLKITSDYGVAKLFFVACDLAPAVSQAGRARAGSLRRIWSKGRPAQR